MWHENGVVNHGLAAEIADLSRCEFIAALQRFGVSPFQVSVGELVDEALDA